MKRNRYLLIPVISIAFFCKKPEEYRTEFAQSAWLCHEKNNSERFAKAIKKISDKDIQGQIGGAALISASRNNCSQNLELLLARGANLDFTDDAGDTALHVASKTKIIEMLAAKNGNILKKNNEGQTPIEAVIADCLDFNRVRNYLTSFEKAFDSKLRQMAMTALRKADCSTESRSQFERFVSRHLPKYFQDQIISPSIAMSYVLEPSTRVISTAYFVPKLGLPYKYDWRNLTDTDESTIWLGRRGPAIRIYEYAGTVKSDDELKEISLKVSYQPGKMSRIPAEITVDQATKAIIKLYAAPLRDAMGVDKPDGKLIKVTEFAVVLKPDQVREDFTFPINKDFFQQINHAESDIGFMADFEIFETRDLENDSYVSIAELKMRVENK